MHLSMPQEEINKLMDKKRQELLANDRESDSNLYVHIIIRCIFFFILFILRSCCLFHNSAFYYDFHFSFHHKFHCVYGFK